MSKLTHMYITDDSFCFRPLPPVPNMEIPEEFAIKAADDIRALINHVLSIASDITIARNPIRLLQVIV